MTMPTARTAQSSDQRADVNSALLNIPIDSKWLNSYRLNSLREGEEGRLAVTTSANLDYTSCRALKKLIFWVLLVTGLAKWERSYVDGV